jgi:hypothetical protein
MKNDRSKAPRDARFPFSFVGRLARRWEERAERFLSELNARGETRLEEISRKIRQTETWIRILGAVEKAERRRDAARETWGRWNAALLGRAGIATDRQIEELGEQLRRLSWRLERIAQKVQENPASADGAAEADEDLRSLA